MFETLRAALLRRSLRKMLATQKRRRKTHTLDSAISIGILFDGTKEKDRQDVLEFATALKEKNKKVRLLGFVDVGHPLGQTLFSQFTQKETRWNGQPKSAAVNDFVSENFDLLLCLNAEHVSLLNWVATASRSAMKIGSYTEHPNDFDMLLETPPNKGVRFFVEQLSLYLTKIIPSKYESTPAI